MANRPFYVVCEQHHKYPNLYIPHHVSATKTDEFCFKVMLGVNSDSRITGKSAEKFVQNLAMAYGRDTKGRLWECFIDSSYYHLPCVKMVDDRNFLSEWNLSFDTIDEAYEAMNDLMTKEDW